MEPCAKYRVQTFTSDTRKLTIWGGCVGKALSVAMMYDADLFRAANEIRSLLALPREVIGRKGLVDRIMEVASTHMRA